ncbi:hypothetical protein P7D52_11870 [Enterococcus dongliensis]|uniref:DUF7736 domain-containing protein n=1 Tax=Enterococcus dongliensis TaxID=2559925 RepID=A0AAW8TKI8_9ENTE|nr:MULTISPECIES: hypothetical protein [Enterococcus]MDT2597333.1 hypothetical protein [Enterococcus dongliensis]MDT2614464.1 hypothetical protein [Enterococcus dongliensis]MDT2635405.1 hypothetical protein [Enterococcus dongliensis]MDT2638152.1 hypothetical protein [Enterococcus dongliensis]MDT2643483.1 hypothetical protein [Enterococcus dongliensis]
MSMTKEEKVILSAYTGYYLTNDFDAIHEYINQILGRTVTIDELFEFEILEEIQRKSKEDFVKVIYS